jgi:hypothetical protein
MFIYFDENLLKGNQFIRNVYAFFSGSGLTDFAIRHTSENIWWGMMLLGITHGSKPV